MKISDAGLDIIKEFEALRLAAYHDPVGLLTIGYGHLVQKGEPYHLGQKITLAEADALLRADAVKAENNVKALVKVALTQNQFDALASFAFNLGSLIKAPTLLDKLNDDNYAGAAQAFDRYVFARGQKLPGLVRRRGLEKALFLKKS